MGGSLRVEAREEGGDGAGVVVASQGPDWGRPLARPSQLVRVAPVGQVGGVFAELRLSDCLRRRRWFASLKRCVQYGFGNRLRKVLQPAVHDDGLGVCFLSLRALQLPSGAGRVPLAAAALVVGVRDLPPLHLFLPLGTLVPDLGPFLGGPLLLAEVLRGPGLVLQGLPLADVPGRPGRPILELLHPCGILHLLLERGSGPVLRLHEAQCALIHGRGVPLLVLQLQVLAPRR
mmetsp:Transcript_106532/g.183681  ORF Transcript_106532/g.183681 Transcript_106532/m.183681 type:complete len:232 (+) Transcript_106532:92-787(+)